MLPFLTAKLGRPAVPEPEESADLTAVLSRGQPVRDSADLRRILALPKRARPPPAELARRAAELKAEFGVPKADCTCVARFHRPCCSELLPVQAWALSEAREVGGLLGPIRVGGGKSLLDLLTPMVVGARVAVLLLPPNLKHQMLAVDWEYYGQHWRLPNLAKGRFFTPGLPTLHVVAYTELSGAKSTDLLERLQPDVIVADEAHSLKAKTAARTKRFLRHFKSSPGTKFFCWSGTLTSKSVKDYAHLSAFSLKEGSPVPLHYVAVEEWASHLDPGAFRAPCGELARLGSAPDAREGYAERVSSTPGVVTSGDAESCSASLVASERKLEAPAEVAGAVSGLAELWTRPDGEELVDALSAGRCARELSCGFFYRWIWPRGESEAVIERWLQTRSEWRKELREKLKGGAAHMDSPMLCVRAAIRWERGYHYLKEDTNERVEVPPKSKNGPLPVWESKHWPVWSEVKDTAKPSTQAVWVSEFMVEDIIEWLKEGPGIVWYEFTALVERVRERFGTGLTHLGPGAEGSLRAASLTGKERVIAAIRSHGTGKHLQMFSRALVANPPSAGDTLEQMLGRLHRPGQQADEVDYDFYAHTTSFRSAIETARNRTEYTEETLTSRMTTNAATWLF